MQSYQNEHKPATSRHIFNSVTSHRHQTRNQCQKSKKRERAPNSIFTMTTTTMTTLRRLLTFIFTFACYAVTSTLASDRDRFQYDTLKTSRGGNIYDYGPEEWMKLDCQGGTNIENCVSSSSWFWCMQFNAIHPHTLIAAPRIVGISRQLASVGARLGYRWELV